MKTLKALRAELDAVLGEFYQASGARVTKRKKGKSAKRTARKK